MYVFSTANLDLLLTTPPTLLIMVRGGGEGVEGGGREEGREGRGENVDTCFTEWCYWRSVMLI